MPKVDTTGYRFVPLLPRWAYLDEEWAKLDKIATDVGHGGYITDRPLNPTPVNVGWKTLEKKWSQYDKENE